MTNLDEIKILSWNVNGIRAIEKKGFFEWLHSEQPDILCLQEIKADYKQLSDELRDIDYYHTFWNSAIKDGYSGTAVLSKEKPIKVQNGFGIKKFDNEGRFILVEYPEFILINSYFPSGGKDNKRADFKIDFHNAFLKQVIDLKEENKTILFCGDVNIAHTEIDLANPKSNKKKSGFLEQERLWINTIIDNDFVDTFRYFHPNKEKCYTWWSYLNNARNNNSGWRIDYFFIDNKSIEKVKESFIMSEIKGSDHCPIGIKMETKNRRLDTLKGKSKRIIQKTLFD